MNTAIDQTSEAQTKDGGRRLGPAGAIVFFVLVVLCLHGLVRLQEAFDWAWTHSVWWTPHYVEPMVILPLAYAFYPQVFTRRFWHFPANALAWLIGLAVVKAFVLFGVSPYPPLSIGVALSMVFIGPPLEEITRAVLISPLLESWGNFWGAAVSCVLTIVAHPSPAGVIGTVVLLTLMFVSTNRSVPATTFAHSMMNAFVVLHAGIRGS